MADKILIVDDDKDLCESVGFALSNEGFNICTVSNGEEALKRIGEILPDLLILDVLMPGLNGFQVCKRVRENPLFKELPILMLTCIGDKESRLKGYGLGVDEYMTKPFGLWELIVSVVSQLYLYNGREYFVPYSRREECGVSAVIHKRRATLKTDKRVSARREGYLLANFCFTSP